MSLSTCYAAPRSSVDRAQRCCASCGGRRPTRSGKLWIFALAAVGVGRGHWSRTTGRPSSEAHTGSGDELCDGELNRTLGTAACRDCYRTVMPPPQRSSIRKRFDSTPVAAERGLPRTMHAGSTGSPASDGWRGLRLSTRSPAPPPSRRSRPAARRGAAPRPRLRGEQARPRPCRSRDAPDRVPAVLAVIGLAIVRESGFPNFSCYRASGVGRFGRPFTMDEVRSMHTGCDQTPHMALVRKPMQGAELVRRLQGRRRSAHHPVGAFPAPNQPGRATGSFGTSSGVR